MLNIATKRNNLLVVLLILTHGFSALGSESSSNLGEILRVPSGIQSCFPGHKKKQGATNRFFFQL
jgi:hypothetical protein